MLKTRESKKSDLSSPSSIFVHLNSSSSCFLSNARTCNTAARCGCAVQRGQDEMGGWNMSPGCPPWASHAGASGVAWGGTGENVKVISSSSYHRNSTCCQWATASIPQGRGQSIVVGSDLHQPPEALHGFAPHSTSNACRRPWSVLQHLQQPLSCQKQRIPLALWNLE